MADEFTKAALYGIKTFNNKVKEKIGIEKLIRYLLESKGEEYKGEYYEWYRDAELEQNIDSLSELKPFIKRLVENDKIDFENMEGHGRLIGYLTDNMEKPTRDKVKEDVVIMLLSISSSPIEDLISYLK